MSTSSITRVPATFTAAAAVVAAIAVGYVTGSVSHHGPQGSGSSGHGRSVTQFTRAAQFGIPTTGGHIVTGE